MILTADINNKTKVSQYRVNNKRIDRDIPGGAVVKNPPANAGDTSLISGLGRSQMLRSN